MADINNKPGLLIAIEGTDGSGKQTQTGKLYDHLFAEGFPVIKLSFPHYESHSSDLVKMYLNGEFGDHPDDVGAYPASVFYGLDRYASYAIDWKDHYNTGGIVLTDRYTISNAIHQAAKLSGQERTKYLDWLFEFEYKRLDIPAPDIVIYLDLPTQVTANLRKKRERDTNTAPDIHEKDNDFLRRSRENALDIAEKYHWTVINCYDQTAGQIRSVQDIHREIYAKVRPILAARGTVRPIGG